MAGHRDAGKVDGTGPTARFNKPYQLTIDEGGQLLVAECGVADSVRVVEASLVSPSRQAAEETAVQKGFRGLQTDLGKLLEDPAGAGSQKLCSRGSQARDARGETKVVLKSALSTVHVATSNTAGVSQDGGEDSPP